MDALMRWDETEQYGTDIKNYAQNDIKGQLELIKSLRSQVNWEGAEAEASLKGYDEFLDEMQKLVTGFTKYGNFLCDTAATYKNTSSKIKNTFENEVYVKRG